MGFDWLTIFQPSMLLLALAGVGFGIIWGAMPALSTNMAMALALGLTYKMDPNIAVLFLLSILMGSSFGGAISAILINIPGTPDAVPTMMAGHPLAREGKGGLALGCSIFFTFIANWMGLIVLVMLVPVMINLALRFSSWEIFLLALLGVAVSGTLTAGERPIKGWISGWLGLALGMVGGESIHGIDRFTFGSVELVNGIEFLPVLVGLFGLTEILKVLREETPYSLPSTVGGFFPPLSFYKKFWKSAVRSGIIGIIIGIIPGTGANVASFISYRIGEQLTKKDFSKGSFEGIVCSEVANNAVIGGAMLPTMTLGIPGSNSTAIFLAALNLHGIIVGPSINQDQPGFMYFLYACLLLTNFLMYGMAFALIKPSVKLFSLPRGVLMPVIAIFCLLGSYIVAYNFFDVYLMFLMGVFGYLLSKWKVPFAPLVLGIILAPMVDVNLRRSLDLYRDNFLGILSRPIGLFLLVAVFLTFYYGIRKSGEAS
jgi:putative tricarboxylic transport membrane protein